MYILKSANNEDFSIGVIFRSTPEAAYSEMIRQMDEIASRSNVREKTVEKDAAVLRLADDTMFYWDIEKIDLMVMPEEEGMKGEIPWMSKHLYDQDIRNELEFFGLEPSDTNIKWVKEHAINIFSDHSEDSEKLQNIIRSLFGESIQEIAYKIPGTGYFVMDELNGQCHWIFYNENFDIMDWGICNTEPVYCSIQSGMLVTAEKIMKEHNLIHDTNEIIDYNNTVIFIDKQMTEKVSQNINSFIYVKNEVELKSLVQKLDIYGYHWISGQKALDTPEFLSLYQKQYGAIVLMLHKETKTVSLIPIEEVAVINDLFYQKVIDKAFMVDEVCDDMF